MGGYKLNILMTGGTGFVGKHLTSALVEKGYHIYIVTRSPHIYDNNDQITYINYDVHIRKLPIIQAVINLAGDSLFGYWTKRKKQRILTSRIETTNHVISMIEQMKQKPSVFISASAVGFYGTSEEMIFTEQTADPGDDFLAHVVKEWEKTAQQAESLHIRTIYTRFGVILGDQGALPLMSLPVKCFAGGKIGSGRQYMSWVHIEDVVRLLIFCLSHNNVQGPVNVTAPYPQQNKEFTKQ